MRISMSYVALASVVSLTACKEPEPDNAPREFTVRVANLTPSQSVYATGSFDTPAGDIVTGPIAPGQSYSFDVVVYPGMQLQLFSMFVESNDAFLAFAPGGISLWTVDGQEPIVGDRTRELVLYDAGTERNEPLGLGPTQPLRQSMPDVGVVEDGRVTVISDGEHDEGGEAPDGVKFPAIAKFAKLEIVQLEGAHFRVVLSNVSPDNLIARTQNGSMGDGKPALLSPGVYTTQAYGVEWFEVGGRISAPLERLAEDADPLPFAMLAEYRQGVSSDLSGVVWAIHEDDETLCDVGSPASPGLEELVENGRADLLLDELAQNAGFIAFGLADRGNGSPVIEPGEIVEFKFSAPPGAQLELVTGYLAANDKFVGACQTGIPLYDPDGVPRTGELAWAVDLYDAGSEVDEPPTLGPNQFERQPRAGSGVDEGEVIREVHGPWMDWDYPPAEQIVSIHVDVDSTEPAKPDDGNPNIP